MRPAKHEMKNHVNFFDLGEDILYLVTAQLQADSPSSILDLAKACKRCNALATPFLYHSIQFDEHSRTRQLTSRLVDKNDVIYHHVHEITVSNSKNKELQIDEAQLLHVISNVKRLQIFRWNYPTNIPESIISSLEKLWPDVKLSVERIAKFQVIKPLSPSPILHSLKFNIRWGDPGTPRFPSELPDLNDVVSESTRLQTLSLSVDQHSSTVPPESRVLSDSATTVPVNSKFVLPQVKSIVISYQSSWMRVPPTIETVQRLTCAILNQARGWSNIRQLNLAGLDPTFTFKHLQGSVPNLKRLDLALQVPEENQVADFLSSIDALQELRIVNYKSNVKSSLKIICSSILEHLSSLETLVFRTPMGYQLALWPSELLLQLQDSKISHLELDLPLEQITWPTYGQTNNEPHDNSLQIAAMYPSLGSLLTGFANVKTMKLWIPIPTSACAFSVNYAFDSLMGSVPPPPLLDDKAMNAATNIFRQIYAQNSNAKLEELELVFQRYYMADRGQQMPCYWPIRAKKLGGGREEKLRLDVTSQAHWN